MKSIGISKIAFTIALLSVITAVSHAQTYTVLTRLSSATGDAPNTPLIQGTNGNLYATATIGGANLSRTYCSGFDQYRCGTLFEVTPAGKIGVVYNFCAQANCADGGLPSAPVVLGPNGNFYGATSSGGTSVKLSCQWSAGCGTIFEITPAGKLTVLYNVCSQTNCGDGLGAGRLILGANGNFYGVTVSGGILNGDAGCPNGCGTVFEISPAGRFTSIYKFCSKLNSNGGCADGIFPLEGLVQGKSGNFYGMTYYGGSNGVGNIFEISPAGKFTELYSFCSQANCADGRYPTAPLILGSDGNLYGTTSSGGSQGGGTAFSITPTGRFTSLYSFCNWANGSCPDGSAPSAGLVQGADGNFYGTTGAGGNVNDGLCLSTGCGTAFQLTPAKQLTNLYSFCAQASCTDGAYPGALMQATDGTLYGIANKGGRSGCIADGGCGTIWSLSMGLAPFVQANPNFGKSGQVIGILGNNLTGTTSVAFNGVPATFKVVSSTYIKAELPTGATTGAIEVTTPNGTLKSNVAFQVLP